MGGHNGPQLGVKMDILVPIHFHVTCIQSSVMSTKIRSAPPPPTSLHSKVREIALWRGCIVLLWTCCPKQYVWCFCLFWLGENRLSEMQFKFQLELVISNINPAISFGFCCTVFVLFTGY